MDGMLFAQVIINNKCKETDREFQYRIPENLIDRISVGCRVIVPFGMGNKPVEAYVTKLSANPEIDVKRIKPIKNMVGETPVLSPQMVELGQWMRDKYMCYYMDALQAMVPTAVRTKSSIRLEINETEDYDKRLSHIRTQTPLDILEFIEDNGGSASMEEISSYFAGVSITNAVNRLVEAGLLIKTHEVKNKMNIKVEKLLYINEGANSDFNRAPKQKQVFEAIAAKPGISIKQLDEEIGDAAAVVRQLVKKELVRIEEKDDFRILEHKVYYEARHKLTELQEAALSQIRKFFEKRKPVLLHGVTGSGKTELYMEIIEEYLEQGKDAIMLVPEIALTPQMISRFKNRFGQSVAVLHSHLSEGEKYDEWRKIKLGLVKVVVGARSAVFAPFANLGIIIIDEEHENTYKSDIKPKYLTREVAEKRCQLEDARLILGSATPMIETYYKAQTGHYGLVELLERVNSKPMPEVVLVDMREELKNGNKTIFSDCLTEAVLDTLKADNQLILFLNRRGHSTFVSCRDCGLVMRCPRCSISLTYHMKDNKLNCHYCGYERENPVQCPKCASRNIRYFGVGTQKVEQEFQKKFSIKNTLRMDADTTSKKKSHQELLDRFRNKESKVLLGTQMISKGLDFPDVTLVGVITADTSLNLPDFRSAEKTFQMVAQVAGRSGRGSKPGRVVVQTYSPEHYSLQMAKNHDYKGFYQQEIRLREQFNYPPFARMASILISGINEQHVARAANELGVLIDLAIRELQIEKLGPMPAPLARIKNKFRWQIVLKGENEEELKTMIQNVLDSTTAALGDVNISIDLNPQNML